MGKPIKKLFRLCFSISLLFGTIPGWTSTGGGLAKTDFACDPPINLSAQNIATTTADLSWQDVGTAPLSWNLEIIPVGESFSGTPNYTNITANPFTAMGLLAGKDYKFKVQAVCENNSAWSNQTRSFTTMISNPSPCAMGLDIFDNSPVGREFPIRVENAPGTSMGSDVQLREVRLIIEHSWERDLDVYLISPSGIQVRLAYRVGDDVIGVGGGIGDLSAPDCQNQCIFSSPYPNDSCTTFLPVTDPNITSLAGRFFPMEPLSNFNDNTDPNGQWILRVIDDRPQNTGQLEYAQLVFSSFSCPATGLVRTTQISDNAITLDWNVSGTCQGAIIEYGPSGFQPGSGQSSGPGGSLVTNVCPPFQLTQLSAYRDYDIYVRNRCTAGGYSENSCVLSVTTECSDQVVSHAEDFDDQSECQTDCGASCELSGIWFNSPTGDDFDWTVRSGPTSVANSGPDNDVSGDGKYIYLETDNAPCWNGNRAILVSECIQVNSTFEGCDLSFYYHLFGANTGSLNLEISADGGLNWVLLQYYAGNQGNKWRKVYQDLSDYQDQIVQLRFVGKGGDGLAGQIALDEIKFFGSTPVGPPQFEYYLDSDADGFGDASVKVSLCLSEAPAGYADNALDCDDTNGSVHPGAEEILCNRTDENCNGMADDSLLPAPELNPDTICPGTMASLSIEADPQGVYYWFSDPQSVVPVDTGRYLKWGPLTETTTFYVQDSILNAPGLRITEVGLNAVDAVEIQSIGKGGDYTGWKVVIGNDRAEINAVYPDYWELGPMNSEQVALRTASQFGSSFLWIRVRPGWVIIIDDEQNIVDALFWNWSAEAISTFNIEVEGLQYTSGQLPWSGPGVDASNCDGSNSLNLIGSEENDRQEDFVCSASSLGANNTGLDFSYSCSSPRIPVEVYISELTVGVDIQPNICNKLFAGSVVLSASGGYGPYEYLWSDGSSESTLLETAAGEYSVTVTDSRNCELTINDIILDSPQFEFRVDILSSTDPTCADAQNGILQAIITDGNAPYQYSWSQGRLNNGLSPRDTLRQLPEGTYRVSVTDANGCRDSSQMVELMAPPPLQIALNKQDLSCYQSGDGRITASVSGGIGGYSYAWSNNMVEAEITNLDPGTYHLTVTDDNACAERAGEVRISEPAPLNLTIDEVQDVRCFGLQTGRIATTVTGGVGDYTFSWTNSDQTTDDLNDLSGGDYLLTVTDGNGCVLASEVITLREAGAPLEVGSQVSEPNNCTPDPKGGITLLVSGGVGNYEYLWNDGTTTKNRVDLDKGSYSVSVTDELGCTVEVEHLQIELESVPMKVELLETVDALCGSQNQGSVSVSVINGSAPYQYNWSIGEVHFSANSVDTLKNLPGGEYAVTVTDANGCVDTSATYAITQNETLEAKLTANDVICYNDSSGKILLDISGGSGVYSFQWSNGSTEKDLLNLPNGSYSVTVTDDNGCSTIRSAFIAQSSPLVLNTLKTDISCHGEADGRIQVAATGGWRQYQYQWSTGASGSFYENLAAGNYTVTVTDAKGCALSQRFTLEEPGPLQLDIAVTPTLCPASDDGKIELNVSGGSAPFSYKWSNQATTQQIENLPAGFYTLSVTDQRGCMLLSDPIQVKSGNQPAFTIRQLLTTDPSCGGTCSGAIDLLLDGNPEQQYQFEWSNGAITEDLTGLCSGEYRVSVSDLLGCQQVSAPVRIATNNQDPFLIVDTMIENASDCSNSEDGSVRFILSGGVAPYTFNWADSSFTDQPLRSGLSPDSYLITISDAAGCTLMDTVEISCKTSTLPQVLLNELKLYPNPTAGQLSLHIELKETAEVELVIFSLVGRQIKQLAPARFREKRYDLHLFDLPNGLYFLRIRINEDQWITRRFVMARP